MLKRFCFITFDKYAHGRNRAKGEGDPYCEICGSLDSLLHMLCSCQRSDLRDIRYQAYTSLDDLLISWRQSNEISRDEDDAIMWSRYLSNVELAGPYGKECWLGVFSDEALTWLFSRAILIVPFPSPSSMIQFSKRWKTMVGLRRKFTDAIILNQQANYTRSTNPGNSIPLLTEIAPHSRHLPPRPRLKNYSLLPFLAPRPGLKRLFSPKKRVRKNTAEFIVPSMLDPPPHRRKRRQRRIEQYFLKSQPPH
jgi:hypothetical protein